MMSFEQVANGDGFVALLVINGSHFGKLRQSLRFDGNRVGPGVGSLQTQRPFPVLVDFKQVLQGLFGPVYFSRRFFHV